jgi:anaerobic selenocysteine-containing dehydrogenase
VALERHYGGGQTVRAVCSLPALVGAWRQVGGGILQMPLWEMPFKLNDISRPDWIRPGTRVVNALQLGRALTGELPDLDPPIKSLMVYNANPVVQAPEAEKSAQGLDRDDLFVVVAEHFLTDTAAYADIILPSTMAAEMDDIMLSWGTFYVTLNQKAVEPPGEAVSNTELFRRLAKTFGFDDPQFKRSDPEMIEHYTDWESKALEGIDLEYLRQHGYAHLTVGTPDTRAPHKEGNFPTATGKCQFKAEGARNFVPEVFREMYTEFQPDEPLDELPDYVAPRESMATNAKLAAKYPLNIISPKSHAFLNSQYANEEHKVKMQGEQFVMINPIDADTRGIDEGAPVRVFNDRGSYLADARVTQDTPAGLVVTSLGYWRALTRGGAVNGVNRADFVNMGHAPAFSDNLVEVALSNV